LEFATHYGVSLLELSPEKSESIGKWLANVNRCYVSWSGGSDASQAIDETVYSFDFRDYYFGEIVSKVDVGVAIRKKFGKCADRDQWVLDLVCNARSEGTKR